MKRKLTQNQNRRIQLTHARRRKEVENNLLDTRLQPQEGLLITRFGKQAIVENQEGKQYTCHLRQNLDDVACGDHVIWQPTSAEHGIITATLARKSTLFKSDFRGNPKAMAANITCICIVIAPKPLVTHETIDSYLVMAEKLNLSAIILFNKSDLINPHDWESFLTIYSNLGYPVIMTSAKEKQGIRDVSALLANHTSIFVGQSGTGKSSLIEQLIPDITIKIGDLSEHHLGKHTTSIATLYHLPQGGYLIDSPGVRRFKLIENQPTLLIQGFIEMRDLVSQCRFRNCSHLNEPNCGVIKAVEERSISLERYESFKNLYLALTDKH